MVAKCCCIPSLSVQKTGFKSDQDQELDVEISQPLDLFGQRRSRKNLAKVELSQVDLNQKLYKAETLLAVKYLWSQVLVLQEEVRPIALTTRVVATGNHANEFRGSKFIEEQKNKSTLELFSVTDEDIIKSFLNKQSDRKNYFYLRLAGDQQQERYALFYGLYSGEREANQAREQLGLKLPASVHPTVRALEDYQAQVNDMGMEELQGSTSVYEVKLHPAALPKPDVAILNLSQPKAVDTTANRSDTGNTSTSTTVTRRDAEGNVIDVQKSQSHAETGTKSTTSPTNSNSSVRQEIADPFN